MYNLAAITKTLTKTADAITLEMVSFYYPATIAFWSPTLVSLDIIVSALTSIDGWCIEKEYAITPVTQTTTLLEYIAGFQKNFIIDQFKATIKCGSPASPSFTYSALTHP